MKLSTILGILVSTSILALTACGTSTIGGGGGTGGETIGTGGNNEGGGGNGPLCNGEPSPVSCAGNGCPDGFTCVADADPNSCHSSSCACEDDGWVCTADCGTGGSTCVPSVFTCNGVPNPVSCTETGCPGALVCALDPDPTTCHPSGCLCNADGWVCDESCGMNGSTCVPGF